MANGNMANPCKVLPIPRDLRVGTLDTLVALSDRLVKDDQFAEGLCRKLANQMNQLVDRNKDKMLEMLQANGRPLPGYVEQFRWDAAKFNTALSADALRQDINKKLSEVETEMKVKVQAYGKVQQQLMMSEKRTTGPLIGRDISNTVKKEMFVLDSEYLVTLLVVVPIRSCMEWETTYESLSEYIVPRSSQKVDIEDKDSAIYTVTLFRRVVDDFKAAARDARFAVKDFEYNESAKDEEEQKIMQLKTDQQRKFNMLTSWLKMAFSEAFIAWIHMKALRVFVESVLRFGLPVNFYSAVVCPTIKKGQKLRKDLNAAYARLDATSGADVEGAMTSVAGVSGTRDYYPYVNFNVEIESFFH